MQTIEMIESMQGLFEESGCSITKRAIPTYAYEEIDLKEKVATGQIKIIGNRLVQEFPREDAETYDLPDEESGSERGSGRAIFDPGTCSI